MALLEKRLCPLLDVRRVGRARRDHVHHAEDLLGHGVVVVVCMGVGVRVGMHMAVAMVVVMVVRRRRRVRVRVRVRVVGAVGDVRVAMSVVAVSVAIMRAMAMVMSMRMAFIFMVMIAMSPFVGRPDVLKPEPRRRVRHHAIDGIDVSERVLELILHLLRVAEQQSHARVVGERQRAEEDEERNDARGQRVPAIPAVPLGQQRADDDGNRAQRVGENV